jgi:4-amino-4-deoxy-L-arabinose transferase-like glycosyltransferase
MPSSLERAGHILDRVLDRVLGKIEEHRRIDRIVLLGLVGYCVVWTLYGVLAKGSQDIHFDMVEMVAWSRDVGLGTAKHPPLGPWLAALWFGVFPLSDWSFYLLAMVTATAALWIAWKASEPYLALDKRLVGLALLTLMPFFNFHALKFNANTVLLPLWGLATWSFLRSFETRRPGWAALAGLAAAAAMMAKYWSVFLLLGLVIAALFDRRRGAYFKSSAPWIIVAAGGVAMAPHLVWLVDNGFAPIRYAQAVHGGMSPWGGVLNTFSYLSGSLAYVAAPLLAACFAFRRDGPVSAEILWPRTDALRLVVLSFWLPLLLPVIAPLVLGVGLTSLWSMSAWTLLPVVLFASPSIAVDRRHVARVMAVVVAVPVIALAAAPVIALAIHCATTQTSPIAIHSAQLASEVERLWGATSGKPLRLVDGTPDLAYGVAFYAAGKPSVVFAIENAGKSANARMRHDGYAIVCAAEDQPCVERARAEPPARRSELTLVRRHLGVTGPSRHYVIAAVPPA